MIWSKFTDQAPSDDAFPILVVWYKGSIKEKHLAVAWRSLQELKLDHQITDEDEITYWTKLTDPEEQINGL